MLQGSAYRNNTFFSAILLSAFLIAAGVYFNWHLQLDDALIYYRYIENALHGNGLVYNPGERYNALTSPLYAYLMLFFATLTQGHIHAVAMLLSGVSHFLLSAFLIVYFLRKISPVALLAIPFLVASRFYFYGVYGMETLLYLALSIAALILFERQRFGALGIVAALLILTRSEMIFLIVAFALEHRLRKMPFPRWQDYIVPALILAIHFGFNAWYYGALLPQSAGAKTTQAMSGLWGDGLVFLNLHYLLGLFFNNDFRLAAIFASTGIIGLYGLRGMGLLRVWFIFLALYTAFYIGFNIPNYHWYYAPYFLTGILGQIGLISLLARHKKTLAILVTAALITANAGALFPAMQQRGPHPHYPAIGQWIRQNVPQKATIGVIEIGHIGWYSKRPIIDAMGLVTPRNAEWMAHREFTRWVEYYRPDYLMLHQPLWPQELALQRFHDDKSYVTVRDFPFPRYQLWRRAK